MRFLLEPEPTGDLVALADAARAARSSGLDGILLRQARELSAPLMAASAVGALVADVRLAVEVEVGDRHPLELAEEAAVVDLATGGRLVLVARPAAAAPDAYVEALDLLRTAFAARPFRFEGRHWRVPANLASNEHRIDDHVRLMPAPAQLRLEVWGAGAGRDAALARGLGFLADAGAGDAELAAAHERAAAALGPALIGAVRARRERLDDPRALVERLRAGRAAFGQDCAVVAGGEDEARALGSFVGPRVQLNRLPAGLEDFWDESRAEEAPA